MKLVTFSLVLILLVANGFAQQTKRSLRFNDFPAVVYKGRRAEVNLSSHPKARMYRTMLRLYAKDGVNFAGHYIIARWGCGSNCLTIAIIDAKSGKVFFPPELSDFGVGLAFKEGNDEEALQYKPNSKLITAEGFIRFDTDDASKAGKYYFVWERNRLRLVRKEKRQWVGNN